MEFLFPYAFPAADIKAKLIKINWLWCCTICPQEIGKPVSAVLPVYQTALRNSVKAYRMRWNMLTVWREAGELLSRKMPEDVAHAVLRTTFIDNLKYAAAELKKANIAFDRAHQYLIFQASSYLERSRPSTSLLKLARIIYFTVRHLPCTAHGG